MLKVRIMGPTYELKDYIEHMKEDKKYKITSESKKFPNKGTKRIFRVFTDVQKKGKDEESQKEPLSKKKWKKPYSKRKWKQERRAFMEKKEALTEESLTTDFENYTQVQTELQAELQ